MTPHVHERSSWTTSSTVDRIVMVAVAIVYVAAAVIFYVTGLRGVTFGLAGLAVVGVVAFAFTALDDDDPVPAVDQPDIQ